MISFPFFKVHFICQIYISFQTITGLPDEGFHFDVLTLFAIYSRSQSVSGAELGRTKKDTEGCGDGIVFQEGL